MDATAFRSIHRDFYKGIYVPAGTDVAVSIRFRPEFNEEWGYSDHWLEVGHGLDYTGQGGPPADQSWNRFNMGLRRALETDSRVHVFEELRGSSPRLYRHWGQWSVTRTYDQFVESQRRRVLRFVIETPD